MNNDLATAMGRALDLTRAGALSDATRLIQDALHGKESSGQVIDDPVQAKPARRPLGTVVDDLAKLRHTFQHRPAKTPPVPEGARYEAREHATPYGTRQCRLFVPSARAEGPVAVVMMLHGCTQNADDFAIGTRMNEVAERRNVVVVYPDQTKAANQMGCWNWFRPEDQRRESGEPALLSDLASTIVREFDMDGRPVFVAGLSAGGAMAAILGCTHPDVFSAIAVHSGLAPGAAKDMPSAFAAMRGQHQPSLPAQGQPMRTIVFHGSADTTVVPSNADAVITSALAKSATSEVTDTFTPGATITLYRDQDGRGLAEKWMLSGVAHAWSGGASDGSYTAPDGVDASEEMMRFFLENAAD